MTARHCDVAEPVKGRLEAQVEKLRRFEPRLSAAELIFTEENHERFAEGILHIDGSDPVVATGSGGDFSAASEQLVDRLSRILRRGRAQRVDHRPKRAPRQVLEE